MTAQMSFSLPAAAPGVVAPTAGAAAPAGQASGFEALLAGLFPAAVGLAGAPAETDAVEDASTPAADTVTAQAQAVLAALFGAPAQPIVDVPAPVTDEAAPDADIAPAAGPIPAQSPFQIAALQIPEPAKAAVAQLDPGIGKSVALAAPVEGPPPPAAPTPPTAPPPTVPAPVAVAEAVAADVQTELAPPPVTEAGSSRRNEPTRRSNAVASQPPGLGVAVTHAAPVAPPPTPSPAPGLLVAAQAQADGTPDSNVARVDAAAPSPDNAPAGPAPSAQGSTPQLSPGSLAAAHAPRAGLDTVASLAAQILKKLDERSTRFQIELEPAGLGKVDVRLEVAAHGRLAASMSFDNAQSAADLRGRAGELTRALEQAGFDVSGGLSFDVAGDQGQPKGGAQDQGGGSTQASRAFQAALEGVVDNDTAPGAGMRLQRRGPAGVDITI